MTPEQPAKKAAAKKKPAAAKSAAAVDVEQATDRIATALDQLDDAALELLVEDGANQPPEAVEEARAILEARAGDDSPLHYAIDAGDAAGARLALIRAIADAMAEVGRVVKDGRNTEGRGYAYATVEGMLKAVRGSLYRRGVVVFAHPGATTEKPVESKQGNLGTCIDLVVDFRFTNGIADYEIHGWHGQGVDYGDKALSKAYTSALKTFVRVQWLLPAESDDPDATSPEGYGKPGGYGQQAQRVEVPPAWAAAASDADKATMLKVLTEVLGDRGVAINAAKQLADKTGGFPSVFAKWLGAFPMFMGNAAEVAKARADEERRKQDQAAEAPHPPAPDPDGGPVDLGAPASTLEVELMAKLDAEQPDPEAPQCGARRGELLCVRRPGHVHRGDAQHITSTGQGFPDDDHITYGPPAEPPAPTLLDPGPVDGADTGPDVGSVRVSEPAAGETSESYLLRLRDAGCTCIDPTGGNLDTINCPIDGHGIPY